MKQVTFIVALYFFTVSSYAANKPEKCPGVLSIKATSISQAFYDSAHKEFIPYEISAYDTKQKWLLVMGGADKETSKAAIDEANKQLAFLEGGFDIIELEDNAYLCLYAVQDKYAFAVTPHDNLPIPTLTKRLFS